MQGEWGTSSECCEDQYSIKKELNRKSLETLEWLATSLHKGRMTEAQFATGLHTVFMCTAGLVSSDVIWDITNAAKACVDVPAEQFEERHYLRRENILVLLTWRVEESKYHLFDFGEKKDEAQKVVYEFGSPADARAGMRATLSLLKRDGYQEI